MATSWRRRSPSGGARIYLDVPRAEATTTLMTAAALAVGVTVIENAALDPEVVDVANMLGLMGADVRGAGSATIRVAGVRELRPVSYSVIPDRIEASLLLGAALSCGGRVRVTDVIPSHLEAVLSKFVEAGASVARGSDWVETGWDKLRPLSALKVRSTAYPGFPACLQPLFAALMCRARGVSVIADPGSDWPYPICGRAQAHGRVRPGGRPVAAGGRASGCHFGQGESHRLLHGRCADGFRHRHSGSDHRLRSRQPGSFVQGVRLTAVPSGAGRQGCGGMRGEKLFPCPCHHRHRQQLCTDGQWKAVYR